MKVKPIAFDSLGVRSAATLVEVGGFRIFIDPGVSYAPRRYGLPPHPLELRAVDELSGNVIREAEKSDVIIITHYHYDHYFPDEDFYRDKLVLVKHPTRNINFSQKKRAYYFLNYNEEVKKARVEYADGMTFNVGEVNLKFSPPIPHGREGSRLGFVLMVSIEHEGRKLLHTSDSQGPMSRAGLEFVLSENPDMTIICGPPTYMEGYKVSRDNVREAIYNMVRIVENVKGEIFIVDHHTLRDLKYKERLREVFEAASRHGKKVVTAAEYLGLKPRQLEARRRELWNLKSK